MIRKAAGLIISISLQMIVCALVVIFLYDAGVKGFALGNLFFLMLRYLRPAMEGI